jgi:hypothetical protein
LAALVTLFLALVTSAPAPAQDLLDDVESTLDRYAGAGGPRRARDFRAGDLYGRPLRLSDYAGRVVVLTFLEARAAEEAVGWLRDTPSDLMGDRSIVFVNVLFPGPTPAFSSRAAKLRKIRGAIEKSYDEVSRRMPGEARRRLAATEIRWIVDGDRDLFDLYRVDGPGVRIFLIDAKGQVRQVLRRRTPRSVKLLDEVLSSLRAEARGGSF